MVLLFLFGVAQFFVYPEPGVPEFLFPLLLLFTTQRSLMHPAHLLLLAGNVFAVVLEIVIFGTASWSVVSVYLTLTSVALLSIFYRYDRDSCVKALLLGGGLGAALTLAALVGPIPNELIYRYGIRFTGFFKDPNVTAPTALFFAVALLAYRGWWRVAAVFPFAIFMISLSRATYLAAAFGLLYAVAFRSRTRAIFGLIVAGIAALFADKIKEFIDFVFESVGRQGLINFYDKDRSSNWLELASMSWQRGAPLGPGFSEANGMAVHSTYLRLLVEQGALPLLMFVIALVICWRAASSTAIRTALLCIIVNGVAIDATHWRIMFIAIPLALGCQTQNSASASWIISPTGVTRTQCAGDLSVTRAAAADRCKSARIWRRGSSAALTPPRKASELQAVGTTQHPTRGFLGFPAFRARCPIGQGGRCGRGDSIWAVDVRNVLAEALKGLRWGVLGARERHFGNTSAHSAGLRIADPSNMGDRFLPNCTSAEVA